jgi:hypothetical protein
MGMKYIVIPRAETPEEIARMRELVANTLAAYLLGARAFAVKKGDGTGCIWGPFRKEKDSDLRWQLDDSNDYWLHFTDEDLGEARIVWRYDGQEADANAIIAVYNLRFRSRRERMTERATT